jgi:hypothetical protein
LWESNYSRAESGFFSEDGFFGFFFSTNSNKIGSMLLLFCSIQIVQGLGIIAWCFYLGMNYAHITEEYFAAFELPPFSWNFDFSFYFAPPLWSRLFTFDLGEFELFGTSIAVQLITLCLSLLRQALVIQIKKGCKKKGSRDPWKG